jgi:hypothetical protein
LDQKYGKNFLHGTWLALLLDPLIKKVQNCFRHGESNGSACVFESNPFDKKVQANLNLSP